MKKNLDGDNSDRILSARKQKIIAFEMTLALILVAFSIGYAFFSLSDGNLNETLSTKTATVSLKFSDNDNGISRMLNMGDSVTKEFTLENTGTKDVYAKINWVNLVNTYTNHSLSYNLYSSDSENGEFVNIGSGDVPVSSVKLTQVLKNGILVPVNAKYYYRLVITFNNLDVNQNSDLSASFSSNFSLEEGNKTTLGVNRIKNLVKDAKTTNQNILEAPSVRDECTNTLAYDGTVDNNLRYVGKNPCNYAIFNGESPRVEGTKWVETDIEEETEYDYFDSEKECKDFIEENGYSESEECRSKIIVSGGWRIIGVMNNIDDGTGKKETRLKLIRNDSLGDYSWDTSSNDINSGMGVNDWPKSKLALELNGDYLNNNLSNNTLWFNGRNNKQTANFNYTNRLTASAQNMIADALWTLGGTTWDNYQQNTKGAAKNFYEYEKGTTSWGDTNSQVCADGACPRSKTWIGKVALMYPSDYGFAVGGSVRESCLNKAMYNYGFGDCGINDWLKPSIDYKWMLSPGSGGAYFASRIYSNGSIDSNNAYNSLAVHPALYLKADISIVSGSGQADDPFVFE